ncbi:MAG: DNA-methyltransferase [Candidatus Kariarchaeaceae archaeon]|jgi:site-specific DNA-methyltransferase (cytosine-N4-specific)
MDILNKVFVEDSLIFLWGLPSGLVDLCITSPPYYNARKYEGTKQFKNPDEWAEFCFRMIVTIEPLLKDTGCIWWNTGPGYKNNRRLNVVPWLKNKLYSSGIYVIDEFPWCKTTYLPKLYSNRPYPAWEHNIIFARRPELVKYYVDQVREPYAESTLKRLKYPVGDIQMTEDGKSPNRKMVKPNPLGKSPPNYFVMAGDKTRRDHPAPMKPELANWAIRAYTKPGDLVLDPMMGCGTTCVEAKKLGRNYVGIDISEEYVKEAKRCLKLM